jgi:hypothetical protein
LAARRFDFEEDNLEAEDPRSDLDEDNLEAERCLFDSLSPLAARRSDFEEDNLEGEDLRSDFDEDNFGIERCLFDSLSPLAVRRSDFEEDNLEGEDPRADFDEANLEAERCFFDSFLSLFFVDSWSESSDFFFLLGDAFPDSKRSSMSNEASESSFLTVSALLACLNFFFKNFTVSLSTSLPFALSNGVSPLSFTTSIDSGAASANIFAVSAEAG